MTHRLPLYAVYPAATPVIEAQGPYYPTAYFFASPWMEYNISCNMRSAPSRSSNFKRGLTDNKLRGVVSIVKMDSDLLDHVVSFCASDEEGPLDP